MQKWWIKYWFSVKKDFAILIDVDGNIELKKLLPSYNIFYGIILLGKILGNYWENVEKIVMLEKYVITNIWTRKFAYNKKEKHLILYVNVASKYSVDDFLILKETIF